MLKSCLDELERNRTQETFGVRFSVRACLVERVEFLNIDDEEVVLRAGCHVLVDVAEGAGMDEKGNVFSLEPESYMTLN